MSRSSDTVVAFLLGAITGGVVALLLAPDKGEVTRRKIKDGATDLVGRSRRWADDATEGIREKAGDFAGKARDRVSGVTDGARQQIDAVKSAVAEGKEAYRKEMERS